MDDQVVRSRISAREIVIGKGVVIEEGATIAGPHGPAERVVLGDSVYIGEYCKFRVPILEIGDYTQIHNHALANGYGALTIGHNGWFGQNCILNATERLDIRNNCGVGAYSQLWTHIAFGDVLQGCRWTSSKPMAIGDDVWFVGHCIVSPITAEPRSMALVGSVVTRDMQENRVYAGSPAKDVTEKVGPQFETVSVERRITGFDARRLEFLRRNTDVPPDLIGIAADGEIVTPGQILFDVVRRTYHKQQSAEEVRFMKFLLPGAKFVPVPP
jgi:acetyltransferase-like isoleucine patch superfamily enzyme